MILPIFSILFAFAITQQTPPSPAFEVASVKQVSDTLPPALQQVPAAVQERMRISRGPERIKYSAMTLKMLLKLAYGVKPDQVLGPKWLDTERYEIVAKLPPGTSDEQLQLMLRNLLAERFDIRLHREKRKLTMYLLEVAQKGPKLAPAEQEKERSQEEIEKSTQEMLRARVAEMNEARAAGRPMGPSEYFHWPSATLPKFADALSSHVDLPVKDATGLEGSYAFTLKWSPERANGAPADEASSLGPTIFVALEDQLGLKLRKVDEEMEVLVIDSAEKVPTSN